MAWWSWTEQWWSDGGSPPSGREQWWNDGGSPAAGQEQWWSEEPSSSGGRTSWREEPSSSGGLPPADGGSTEEGTWRRGWRGRQSSSSGGEPPAQDEWAQREWAGAHNWAAIHRRYEGFNQDGEGWTGPSNFGGWYICIRPLGWQSKKLYDDIFNQDVLWMLKESVHEETGTSLEMKIRGRAAEGRRSRPGRKERNELLIWARDKDTINVANRAWNIIREEAVKCDWGVGDEEITVGGVVIRGPDTDTRSKYVKTGEDPAAKSKGQSASGGVPPGTFYFGLPEDAVGEGSGGEPPADKRAPAFLVNSLFGEALTFDRIAETAEPFVSGLQRKGVTPVEANVVASVFARCPLPWEGRLVDMDNVQCSLAQSTAWGAQEAKAASGRMIRLPLLGTRDFPAASIANPEVEHYIAFHGTTVDGVMGILKDGHLRPKPYADGGAGTHGVYCFLSPLFYDSQSHIDVLLKVSAGHKAWDGFIVEGNVVGRTVTMASGGIDEEAAVVQEGVHTHLTGSQKRWCVHEHSFSVTALWFSQNAFGLRTRNLLHYALARIKRAAAPASRGGTPPAAAAAAKPASKGGVPPAAAATPTPAAAATTAPASKGATPPAAATAKPIPAASRGGVHPAAAAATASATAATVSAAAPAPMHNKQATSQAVHPEGKAVPPTALAATASAAKASSSTGCAASSGGVPPASAAAEDVIVEIVTFGLAHRHRSWNDFEAAHVTVDLSNLARSHWGDPDAEKLLTRDGRPPQGKEGSGMATNIRKVLLRNTSFCDCLMDVAACVTQHKLPLVRVAVACKWGKHRSVALGEELQDELRKVKVQARVLHLERTRWDYEWRRQFSLSANQGIQWPVPRPVLGMTAWASEAMPSDCKHFIAT